jgi:hypothetical protein
MRDYGSSAQLFQSTPKHVLYAFQVLDAFLKDEDYDGIVPEFDDVNTALFVTWNKDHLLRGCIGTLEPRTLHKGLKDYALTAAGWHNCVLALPAQHACLFAQTRKLQCTQFTACMHARRGRVSNW